MDGFEPIKQLRKCTVRRHRFAKRTLTWLSMGVVVCLVSGCASTQNAWRNLTAEPPVQKCSCGSCSCGERGSISSTEQSCQCHQKLPQPPEGQDSTMQSGETPPLHDIQPHGATEQQVNRPHPAESRPDHSRASPQQLPAATPDTASHWLPNPQQHVGPSQNAAGDPNHRFRGSPSDQSSTVNDSSLSAPPANPATDALREYRTQIQILSEQISQMKNAQDSIRASQDALQQLHEREILKLKLQQTTADRDRLQRERELELELEKQRRRELEAIDSLTQMIEGAGLPASVSGTKPALAPGSTVRASKKPTVPETQSPPVH